MINYQTDDTILAFTTERMDAVPEGMILPVQTHSCHVAVVREAMADYPDTDALVTLLFLLPASTSKLMLNRFC